MQKIISVNRYLACIIIGIFLLSCPSRFLFSEETESSQIQQTPEMKGYNYNLKELLKEVEQNLKEVDKKLKEEEVKKLNEQREVEIRKYFEKGNQLYKQGDLKGAKQQWQKALEISKDPQMRNYIKEAESKARAEDLARKKEEQERQKRIEAEAKTKQQQLKAQAKIVYDEAVSLYKSRNYQQAQVKFEQAAQIFPHYSKTDSYLNRIPQDIQKEKERLAIEEKRQEEIARKNKEQELQKQLKAEAKEKERVEKEKQKQLAAEQKEKARQLNEQAKIIYNEAVSLYRAKNYKQAQVKFEQTAKLIPNYASTDYYLKRIAQNVQKEKERQAAEKKRQEKLAQKEQERKQKQAQLDAERKSQKKPKERAREEQRQLNEQAKATYNEAVSLYRAKNYKQAQVKFEQTAKLIPNYASTDYYLKRIAKNIQKEELEQKRKIESLYTKAVSLYKQGQLQESRVLFLEILSLDPTEPRALDYIKKQNP